ncbi:lysylphosphatidylglycerol synthase transmembrane domain-containing protein [Blastochloris sulfoviridis]|uniref:Flippase-like domain-containing protein n=1 Tax=Blastochloris sulfoviridis TaxID=50712 RepID=A0A5M6I174_9HYPH|nr:lysylphosphatidylglycerol synthase transmembrane domain-containing protein [Blastochloris sulfoviridis]KAA5601923.1 flippase-like domain-containing protein [Blastochloris sulfoviridis]
MKRNLVTFATVLVAIFAVTLTFWLYGASGIVETILGYSPGSILLALAFLSLNYVIAFARFLFVIRRLSGECLAWPAAFAAYNVGQISSIFLFNIVGQSLGRAAMLSRQGIGVDASVVGTYVERLVATAVLGLSAVFAAILLFGTIGLTFEGGFDYLLAVTLSLTIAACFAWLLVLRGRQEWRVCTSIVPTGSLLWLTVLLTVIAQIAMGAAYWVLLSPHTAGIDAGQIAAALVIVMFTSSLPISFSGWGIRELSAAKALGLLGVLPTAAVASALTIGTISLVIPLIGAALSAILARVLPDRRRSEANTAGRVAVPGAAALVLILAFATAILVLFQVRVPFENHVATVSPGDAGALTALGLVGYLLWRQHRGHAVLPPAVLGCLGLLSLVVGYALCIGYVRFGTIDWAWLNRGLGWIVCLGYVSVGAGVVLVAGDRGRLRVLAVFLVALLTVSIIQIGLYAAAHLQLFDEAWFNSSWIEGFALNRNAFGFQLAIGLVVAWLFVFRDVGPRYWRWHWRWHWFSASCLFLATYLTLSRAAFVTLGVLIVLGAAFASRPRWQRLSVFAAALATATVLGTAAPTLEPLNGFATAIGRQVAGDWRAHSPKAELSADLAANRQSSDAERWQTINDGLALWRRHLLFGAGLGGYVQERLQRGESFQVIHSVPVWLLAEAGAAGLILTLAGVGWVLLWLWRQRDGRQGLQARAAAMALAVFGVFGLVHDVFAQRTFWFVFGLLVAMNLPGRSSTTTWSDAPNRESPSVATG